jgi:hypothetical protein
MGDTLIWLALAVGFAAALYSSVGHGGASAYIALMALAGLAPAEIRPVALVLNILVAGLGAFRYVHAGRFGISSGRLRSQQFQPPSSLDASRSQRKSIALCSPRRWRRRRCAICSGHKSTH